MTTALARQHQDNALARLGNWEASDLMELRQTIGRELNEPQFKLFCQVCARTGLDPFARQIYAVVRKGTMTIQTGIDGYRVIALRSKQYRGQQGPFWCGEDGVWKDVWLSSKPPAAAKVGVLREGFADPVWGIVKFSEFNGGGNMWQNMPANQLAKCAEAQALRKAFPDDMRGIYTTEEMEQADAPVNGAPVAKRVSVNDRLKKAAPVAEAPVVTEPVIDHVPEAGKMVDESAATPESNNSNEALAWIARIEQIAQARRISPETLGQFVTRWKTKHGIASHLSSTPEQRAEFEEVITSGKLDPKPAAN